MTSLYQFLEGDEGLDLIEVISPDLHNQTVPGSAKPILIEILNEIGDPVAQNLTVIVGSSVPFKQGSFLIPNQSQAQRIIGQAVGYLLQWLMTDWIDGGFTALAVEGNLISILGD